MRAIPFRVLAALALLLPLAVAAPPAAGQAGEGIAQQDLPIPVPETITARHVPPIRQGDVADLLPYENLRSASFQDWHPSERRVLITTRFGEVSQLHEVAQPLGARRQLTFYGERVLGGEYRPAAERQIGFQMDRGGAENYQLFLMDAGSGKVTRLSDGEHRYEGARFSPDGAHIAYVSNRRNGRDFDLYVADPDDPASERRVAELAGAWYPTDWSPDGRRILLLQYISANQSFLHLADVASGALTALTPPPEGGGEPVFYGPGRFSADGGAIYTTTDRGSEFQRLSRLDLGDRRWTTLTEDIAWNVESFDLSQDGSAVAFLVNEDGFSRLHLRDARTNQPLPAPDLPLGVANSLRFRPGSQEVGFTLSWARSSSDVYSWDPRTAQLTRWTESEMGGLPAEHFALPELVRFPTFDEVEPGVRRTIPAFVFRPDRQRHAPPWPVYIDIHGGPEGQERPSFQGTMNHLPANLGVAVIYPNVRGSAGYGKSYLLLDNGERREDSVKDIGALLDWIATQPDLDAGRVMVGGGSYGGYMTLASMVAYNDRLCCGFDYVGISDFVTFLENTEGYRRDLRRAEYGDERDPEMRRFLASIAPLAKADRITRPMLVAQGANDPRVPLSEADQIVAALEKAGTPVWYVVAADEGHGFSKKSNSDYLRAVTMEFIEKHLLAPAPEEANGAEANGEEANGAAAGRE